MDKGRLTLRRKQESSKLIGTWILTERTQLEFGRSPWTRSEEELKADGLYEAMTFMEDGKTKVTAKYLNTDTVNGWQTWKAVNNTLTLTEGPAGKIRTMNWNYELQEDRLILTSYGPDKKTKMTNTWRKKE